MLTLGFQNSMYDYDYYASRYANTILRGRKPIQTHLYVRLASKRISGGRWLDVGCGFGNFVQDLPKRYRAAGLDSSPEAINTAKSRVPWGDFTLGSIDAMPFQANTFEVVTALDVYEHLENPDGAVQETHRVLRNGGILLCQVPNPSSWGRQVKGREWFAYRDETHRSLLPVEEWRSLFLSNGFELLDLRYDGLWDPPYLARLPEFLQWLIFKVGSMLLLWLGLRFSKTLGEDAIFVALKTAG